MWNLNSAAYPLQNRVGFISLLYGIHFFLGSRKNAKKEKIKTTLNFVNQTQGHRNWLKMSFFGSEIPLTNYILRNGKKGIKTQWF